MHCENCGFTDAQGHYLNSNECPSCGGPFGHHVDRDQPGGVADEMRLRNLPAAGGGDDMGGNPLQEGILGDWQHPMKRDESFPGTGITSNDLRATMWHNAAEFEVTDVVPPDASSVEAQHHATIQLPQGITDNLHEALGQTRAWVENPYENGALRPYYNYWQSIRPKARGALRIGVQDPQMAEVINHVAQTDDLGPLHLMKTAFWAALAPIGEALGIGGGAAAAEGAGAASGGGISGLMTGAMSSGLGTKVLQGGAFRGGEDLMGGGGQPGGGGGQPPAQPPAQAPVQDASYFSRAGSDENNAYPSSHDEIPQNKDGDSNVKSDGDNQHWQKDYSVDSDGGGARTQGDVHPVQFDPNGPGIQRLQDLLPLVMHYFHSEDSGEHDPLMQELHQALDQESPGYLDHANPEETNQIIMALKGQQGDQQQQPHQGPSKKERIEQQQVARTSYMPNMPDLIQPGQQGLFTEQPGSVGQPGIMPGQTALTPQNQGKCPAGHPIDQDDKTCPQCGIANPQVGLTPNRMAAAPYGLENGVVPGPVTPEEEGLQSHSWPEGQLEQCPHCGESAKMHLGMCPYCQMPVYNNGEEQAMAYQAADITHLTPELAKALEICHGNGYAVLGPDGKPIGAFGPAAGFGTPQFAVGPGNQEAPPEVAEARSERLRQAGDTQGPHTPEQISAVQQLLIDQGRVDEVPQVPLTPENFANELAEVANATDTPPQDSLSQTPPEPAQEEAPPQATMPMPGMSGPAQQQMMQAAFKYGADSIADKCPKCEGHSTGMLDISTGISKCHSCGNEFKTDVSPSDGRSSDSFHEAAPHHDEHTSPLNDHHPNEADVSAADFQQQEDPEREEDSSQTWKDENGDPLRVGQEYEMYSDKYDIPDIIRLEGVKPDSINYTITGEYGLEHSTEISHQEALLDGLTFRPSGNEELGTQQPDEGLEENMDAQPTQTQGDQGDLSTPHQVMTHREGWVVNPPEDEIQREKRRVIFDDLNQAPAEAGIPPTEDTIHQRDLHRGIFADPNDEQARADWDKRYPGQDPQTDLCQNCQQGGVGADGRCAYCGQVAGEPHGAVHGIEPVSPAQVPREGSVEDHGDPALDWLRPTAGQHFTPMEQRELIEEGGTARNAEKLDLDGTHYQEQEATSLFW